MKQKYIKVVSITEAYYVPDLSEDSYVNVEADTIDKAMELDKKDVNENKISVNGLVGNCDRGTTTYSWEVVELDE